MQRKVKSSPKREVKQGREKIKRFTCIVARLCKHLELIHDIPHTSLHKTPQQLVSRLKGPISISKKHSVNTNDKHKLLGFKSIRGHITWGTTACL